MGIFYDNKNGFTDLKQENGKLYGRINGSDYEEIPTQGPQGGKGDPGEDGHSAYVYHAFASDSAGTGFTLVDDGTLAWTSWITTDHAIASPTLSDFSVWVRRKGTDGDDSYCYVAYATDNAGTGFSLTPSNSLKYRAEIHVDHAIASPTLADFSGSTWVKYIGDGEAQANWTQTDTTAPDYIKNKPLVFYTMPTASSEWVGVIILYMGEGDGTFTTGKFYKCYNQSGQYTWLSAGLYETANAVYNHRLDTEAHNTLFSKKANTADLAPVATSGDYDDLSNKPTIPSTAAEVGADPAGTAASSVSTHNSLTTAHDYRLLPTGTVVAYAGSTLPSGYLPCYGAAYSRTTYAALFAAIGTTYGAGDGSTTFNVPNLTDKFIQGNSTVGTVKAAGLPNITGEAYSSNSAGPTGFNDSWTGAFAPRVDTAGIGSWIAVTNGYSTDPRLGLRINAAGSNSIYGNSTTVQPPALTMNYAIKY